MKRIIIFAMLVIMLFALCGCRQSEVVQHNLKKDADAFNIRRRITVLNTRTDKPLMQVTGLLSIDVDKDGDLNIIIEKSPNEFVMNYAHLSQDTTYIVEQIETKEVNKYQYEIVFYPKQIVSGWIDLKIEDD